MTRQSHDTFGTILTAALLALLVGSAVTHVYAQDALTILEDELPDEYAFTANVAVTDPASFKVQIAFDRQDAGDHYLLDLGASAVTLQRVVGGEATPIGACKAPANLAAGEYVLTIQRMGWRMVAILGSEVVARGWDSTLSDGTLGYMVAGGTLVDPFVQPLGEMYMADDFVRVEDAQSSWESLQGVWRTQSLRVDEQADRMEADKSMNAFSYLGKSSGDVPGLTTMGYWFWANYDLSAAVRAAGTDALGLVAYLQDVDNYIAAVWTSALADGPDADKLSVIQVVAGERTVLAEVPGGHLPDQWYNFRLRVCDGMLECAVDGETRLVTTSDAFGQGQPGLYCQGTAGTNFDSVLLDRWEMMADNFDVATVGRWIQDAGSWDYADGQMRGRGDGERFCVTGGSGWERYLFSADVYLDGKGGIGLVACATDDAKYIVRFGANAQGYSGQAQLMLQRGDERMRELTSAPAKIKPKDWHRVTVVVEEGLVTAYLDGQRVLSAFDDGAAHGRVGLYVEGGSTALFDNAYLALLPARRSTRLTKEFTEGDEHPEMAEWASTRAPWIKPADGAEQIWWTKGDYYGDKEMRFSISKIGTTAGTVRLRIDSDPAQPDAGLLLIIEATSGSKDLKVSLLRGDNLIEEAQATVQSDPCPVLVERRGTYFVATVDGQVVLNTQLK